MAKIKIDGLDKLQKALKDNVTLDEVKELVHRHGSQMHRKMQSNANFKGHYEWVAGKGKVFKKPTGTTKRSIFLDIEDEGFSATVGPGETPLNPKTGLPSTEYSPYLEYGTRYMAAQPFIRPAFEEQKEKFKRAMQRLVK